MDNLKDLEKKLDEYIIVFYELKRIVDILGLELTRIKTKMIQFKKNN